MTAQAAIIMGDELASCSPCCCSRLSVMCVSVYLQGALGRFEALLRQSLPFLAASIASVPLALAIGNPVPRADDVPFMSLVYALLSWARRRCTCLRDAAVGATPQKVAA
jgi:hypothetical protein